MNLMNNSGPLYLVGNHASIFLDKGLSYQNKGISGAFGAKILYALQIAITSIALPLIFATGLLETAYQVFTCQGSKAMITGKTTCIFLSTYLIRTFNSSIVGFCTTPKITENADKFLQNIVIKVINFYSCKQENSPYSSLNEPIETNLKTNCATPHPFPHLNHDLYTIEEGKEKSSASSNSSFEETAYSKSVALSEAQLGFENNV